MQIISNCKVTPNSATFLFWFEKYSVTERVIELLYEFEVERTFTVTKKKEKKRKYRT